LWLLASLLALLASVASTASATLTALPAPRRIALRDSLTGRSRNTLDRYIQKLDAIETRWLVLRALGLTGCALALHESLPSTSQSWSALLAVGLAVVGYGLAAVVLMALAERRPERSAIVLMGILRPFEILAVPLAIPLALIGRVLGRSAQPTASPVTETEVEMIVNEGEQHGALDHDQSEMIKNVLDFGDLSAAEVMVPRTQVIAFELGISNEELVTRVLEGEHSRYPVYREHIDNVVGVLHVLDLFRYVASGDLARMRLDDIVHKPVAFVPESQPASSVLKDMRAGRHHMAVVIDEFGGMSGIVTLEDLLEEIVGDIRDEHDDEEAPIMDMGGGHLLVDASVPIADLSRYLGAELPDDGDYNSLGGFIVDRLGRLPGVGATLTVNGWDFVVRDANERRVSKVEIIRASVPSEAPPTSRPPTSYPTA
jgi:CBS domain containing-hemolysin-like protein